MSDSMDSTKKRTNKEKEADLRRTVRSAYAIGLELSIGEIASLTGISKRTIASRSSDGTIDGYKTGTDEDISAGIEALCDDCVRMQIAETLKALGKAPDKTERIERTYGIVLGMHLKRLRMLDTVGSLHSVCTAGYHLTKLTKMVTRSKNDDGTPIHSQNTSVKYLTDNKIDKDVLFEIGSSYSVGVTSKLWKLKDGFKDVIKECNHLFLERYLEVVFPAPPMKETVFPLTIDLTVVYDHMVMVYPDEIADFDVPSLFSLLTRIEKYENGRILIPVLNTSEKAAHYQGRKYTVFCALHGEERRKLGYWSYDLNAALQSISLQLTDATEEEYPLLWKYTHDKAYKKETRKRIAEDLKCDVSEVKKMLTAYANGKRSGMKKHPLYAQFQRESDRLRRKVLAYADREAPEVLKKAMEQSDKAKYIPTNIDWQDTETEESTDVARACSSVFFFVWTYYEAKIRDVMMIVFFSKDGLEVHDAVYSMEDVDVVQVEKAIKESTGFDIVIDKEPPLREAKYNPVKEDEEAQREIWVEMEQRRLENELEEQDPQA